MAAQKIGIIGSGNVGSALARGLKSADYEVRSTEEDKEVIRQTGQWAEVIILAVPFGALDEVVETLGDGVRGKIVVDVTNALDENSALALGFSTSGAEELQKKMEWARVVKAFNTVFAQHMDSGRLKDQRLTVFAAGDDEEARVAVLEMAKSIGFDAVDAGPL